VILVQNETCGPRHWSLCACDLAAAFLCIVLSVSAASAEECSNIENQKGLNDCAFDKFRRSDQELGDVNKTIRDRLRDNLSALTSLEVATEAWTVYRDAECLFLTSGTAGGTSHVMNFNNCKEQLTHARADRLKNLLKCEEGDPACPVPNR
jgi:uncharacterized protein YecT (DUF1311 family)